jgi:DNA-binding transcriptional MocR family regulator
MPSPLSTALVTQWIEDGTADRIRRFIRAESAARQAIARDALDGFEFQSAENAFNIWLALPKGMGRADIVARLAGRQLGVMPADAFTVSGAPQERLRISLGGSVTRETLRENLYFLGNTLSPNAYMG